MSAERLINHHPNQVKRSCRIFLEGSQFSMDQNLAMSIFNEHKDAHWTEMMEGGISEALRGNVSNPIVRVMHVGIAHRWT
ncbi:unnamed protein product [Allacma fusca]|uniref:Uncharacterized protein n=1 Tax=Allacma fusca TaxID=39272 RepID=A0A8J2P427_9HEXA|nr:unnamed protein product [Allacma fusca]